MLTLYILETTEYNRSVTKTVRSVEPALRQFNVVKSIDDINAQTYKRPWYLVLYDNEYLSLDLRKAVENILKMDIQYDALIFLQKDTDGKLYQSPRLFKKHVKLAKDCLLPEDRSIKMERILDGWVNKHAI